jgi:hypothetical protein
MLYLNANEEKRMVFEVDIRGVEANELNGYVRFNLYGVEIGFPVEIEHKKITALVPPLVEVVEREIEDGTVIEGKLELFTDRHYFKPWEGEIKIGAPMGIKAKLSGENTGPKISTKLVSREISEPVLEKEERISSEITKEDIQSMIFNTLKGLMKGKENTLESTLLSEKTTLSKPKRSQISEQKKRWTKEKLKNITEEEIIAYMNRKGTKNKMVQEVILNEARSKAKSSDNFKVFVEVVKALKKPR